MHVTGYWPLEGSTGIAFLRKAMAATPAALEKQLCSAMENYVCCAGRVAAGLDETEIEPENFAVLVESSGGELKAMLEYGIRQVAGKYWMRKETGKEAVKAFVACAIIYCACGKSVAGEIFNGGEAEIEGCGRKLPTPPKAALSLATATVNALLSLDDLSDGMPTHDVAAMAKQLGAFREQFMTRT